MGPVRCVRSSVVLFLVFFHVGTGMCPKGDDPLTPFSDYRTIRITTSASSGTYGGYYKFNFNGQSFVFPANASEWSYSDCIASFESLPNVDHALCSDPIVSNEYLNAQYTVQLISFPLFPFENNLYLNDGNPPLAAFTCDTFDVTGVSNPTCTVSDVAVGAIPGTLTPRPLRKSQPVFS